MQYVFKEQSNVKSLNSHTVLTLLSFFLKITKRLATQFKIITIIFAKILIIISLNDSKSTNTYIITQSTTPVANRHKKNLKTSKRIFLKPVSLLSNTHFRFVTQAKKTAATHAIIEEVTVFTQNICAHIQYATTFTTVVKTPNIKYIIIDLYFSANFKILFSIILIPS